MTEAQQHFDNVRGERVGLAGRTLDGHWLSTNLNGVRTMIVVRSPQELADVVAQSNMPNVGYETVELYYVTDADGRAVGLGFAPLNPLDVN